MKHTPFCLECMSSTCSHFPHRRVRWLAGREVEILELLAKGLGNKQIAHQAKPPLSEGTVKVYLSRLFDKIGVESRLQAGLWARDHLPQSTSEVSPSTELRS